MEEMAARIQSMMPSPEEIMKMAEIEAHNDEIKKKREARLAARKARQAKKPKKRKRR
jgi:hypothetical protein